MAAIRGLLEPEPEPEPEGEPEPEPEPELEPVARLTREEILPAVLGVALRHGAASAAGGDGGQGGDSRPAEPSPPPATTSNPILSSDEGQADVASDV